MTDQELCCAQCWWFSSPRAVLYLAVVWQPRNCIVPGNGAASQELHWARQWRCSSLGAALHLAVLVQLLRSHTGLSSEVTAQELCWTQHQCSLPPACWKLGGESSKGEGVNGKSGVVECQNTMELCSRSARRSAAQENFLAVLMQGGKASAATPAVDSSTVLMGIAQTLERLSERFDKMDGQSTRAAPERKSRPKRPRSPVESISSSDKDVQNHPKRKRKISRKGKSRSTRKHGEDSDESSVFMGVVISSYPERGWHLVNHMANILKARTMANESAAIEYDEAFRKRASYSAVARLSCSHSGAQPFQGSRSSSNANGKKEAGSGFGTFACIISK
ncbi:UNVERIFIED_CONTAM: hypothetical protein K2H54_043850 [Gekko kuhli]